MCFFATEEEINFLLDTLNENFKLKCRKSIKRPGQWIIVIPKSQVNTVADLVIKYMHPSMFYKVGRKKIFKLSNKECGWDNIFK